MTESRCRRRRSGDLSPRPEIWRALDDGRLLRPILETFYARVFASERLAPYFSGVTIEHVIGKQHSFLMSIMTGERVYFGQRMRNAHHWMVISDELFDEREHMFKTVLHDFELPSAIIDDWMGIHQIFRKQIVKSMPVPKKIGGIALPLEGYDTLRLEVGGLCDSCGGEMHVDDEIAFHVRTGKAYCPSCRIAHDAHKS